MCVFRVDFCSKCTGPGGNGPPAFPDDEHSGRFCRISIVGTKMVEPQRSGGKHKLLYGLLYLKTQEGGAPLRILKNYSL